MQAEPCPLRDCVVTRTGFRMKILFLVTMRLNKKDMFLSLACKVENQN